MLHLDKAHHAQFLVIFSHSLYNYTQIILAILFSCTEMTHLECYADYSMSYYPEQ